MAAIGTFIVVGTALGLTRALPQLIRLVRTRGAHGVSADTAGTISVVSLAWAAYGMLTDQIAVALGSGCGAVMFALITLVALRFGRRLGEMRTTAVWLIVMASAGWIGGAEGLGLLLPISVLVANVPQLFVAWRERDLSSLSLGTWMLSVAEAVVWGTYGLLAEDPAILLYNALHLITSVGIVSLRMAKAGRMAQDALATYPSPTRV